LEKHICIINTVLRDTKSHHYHRWHIISVTPAEVSQWHILVLTVSRVQDYY